MTYTFEQLKEDVRKEAEALRERNKRPKTYSYMIGEVYGRLTVKSTFRIGKIAYAKCLCSCGKEHDVKIKYLQEFAIQSCGCLQKERVRETFTKYSYNRAFFVSNTPEMYYVLGLMYTDGNLSPDKCRFRLGFQAEDKYLLEMVGMKLKGSKKLDLNKANGAYEVAGTDEVIYQQLKDHGVPGQRRLVHEKEIQ